MSEPNRCPKCNSENIYADGNLWVCPECSHEWSAQASALTEVAAIDGLGAINLKSQFVRKA